MSRHWDTQWKDKGETIARKGKVVDDFRADIKFIANIEPQGGITQAEKCCDDAAVPYFLREDTLVGNPLSVYIRRQMPVTPISLRHAYFANTITTSYLYPAPMVILEIGAGFGGLSATLSRILSIGSYFFIDAEPCLAMQRSFTSRAIPEIQTYFLKTDEPTWPVPDLVINTHSFAEMDLGDVSGYFEKIQRALNAGGVLYSVNRLEQNTNFRDYPYDSHWRHSIVRLSRCHSAYVECLSVRDFGANSPHPVTLL